jgi:hypothetical protein
VSFVAAELAALLALFPETEHQQCSSLQQCKPAMLCAQAQSQQSSNSFVSQDDGLYSKAVCKMQCVLL